MNGEMNLKQMQDDKFEWVNPRQKKGFTGEQRDVSISLITIGTKEKGHDGISIIFRNKIEERVGTNLELAVYKNRVFFRQTDVPAMNMLSNRETPNRYGKIGTGAIVQTLKNFIGDYDLKYDTFYELFYIEREER